MNLPNISFVEVDTEKEKQQVIANYEAITGRTLASGDPVRLFIETIVSEIIQLKVAINHTGLMNLTAFATGGFLDYQGNFVGAQRLQASSAITTIKIKLSTAQASAITIPKGTRVTTANSTIYFATDEVLIIPSGKTEGSINATCTTTGIVGNEYLPGQLNSLVDPIAYVDSVSNIVTTQGGTDIEDDEPYRERIQEAPESFSCAGPYGAYRYYAKTASAQITDVQVITPEPGVVSVIPLLKGGEIPDQAILDKVASVCNADKIRPLTDKLQVVAPTAIHYDINVKYFVSNSIKDQTVDIQAKVTQAVTDYIEWQKAALGRDIDPSKLYQLIVDAGGSKVSVSLPVLTEVGNTQVAIANPGYTLTFGGAVDD